MEQANLAKTLVTEDRPLLQAEIHHLLGNLYFPAADIANCLKEHEAAIHYSRLAKSPEWEARALSGLGDASYLAGRMQTSNDHFRKCVALSQDLGLGRTEVANRHMVGWTRIYLNELAEAKADGEVAVDMAHRAGQTRSELLSYLMLSTALVDLGSYDEALAMAETSVELARRLEHSYFLVNGLSKKAEVLMHTGRREAARNLLDECIDLLSDAGWIFNGPKVLCLRGIVADTDDERATYYARADRILAEGCVSHNYFWSYRDRLEAALEAGNWEGATDFADRLENYALGEPLPWSTLFVAVARVACRAGQGERNAELVAEISDLQRQVKQAGFARAAVILEQATS